MSGILIIGILSSIGIAILAQILPEISLLKYGELGVIVILIIYNYKVDKDHWKNVEKISEAHQADSEGYRKDIERMFTEQRSILTDLIGQYVQISAGMKQSLDELKEEIHRWNHL